jgi:hypothetical protein
MSGAVDGHVGPHVRMLGVQSGDYAGDAAGLHVAKVRLTAKRLQAYTEAHCGHPGDGGTQTGMLGDERDEVSPRLNGVDRLGEAIPTIERIG